MNPTKQAGALRMGSPMGRGLLYSFITMAVCVLAASTLLISGDQGEEVLPTYALVIHGLSVLCGSFSTGRRSGRKGWYYGGLLGVFYSIIVLIIGFLSLDRGLDLHTVLFVVGAFVVGAVGGIMGVNTRK